MSFISLKFLWFYIIVLLICYVANRLGLLKYEKVIIACANAFFYINFGTWMFLFMLLSIALTFFFAILMDEKPKKKKMILAVNIILFVFILLTFKYAGLFAKCFDIFSDTFWPELIMPIGISFYFFKLLSYSFDVYNKKVIAERDFISLFAWSSFFATICSGPITKYRDVGNSFINGTVIEEKCLNEGLIRILKGLFKKVVVADSLAVYVNAVYTDINQYSGWALYVTSVMYTIQIYCDFSGYSDIAIGCAKMLGIDLKENFKNPYLARSVKDFWRRWHISLTNWFTEYVYFPLKGNRVNLFRWMLNVLIVFVVSGIWHGANWTFIVWGIYHGIFNIISSLIKEKKRSRILGFFSTAITFNVVNVGWILFRSDSISNAILFIKRIFIFNEEMPESVFGSLSVSQIAMVALPILILFVLELIEDKKGELSSIVVNRNIWTFWAVSVFLLYFIYIYIPVDNIQTQFIYFRF